MNKGVFAICEPDKEYAGHLAEYIRHHNLLQMEICIFTNVEHLNEGIKKRSADMLLLSENCLGDFVESGQIKQYMILTEGNVEILPEIPVVYKYQPASELMNEIIKFILSDSKGHRFAGGKKSGRVLGMFSPSGGAGITTYALALAKELSREEQVLYVSMEPLSGFSGEESGLSELLYYTRQQQCNILLKVKSLVRKQQGVDCIYSVGHYRDLQEIQDEDLNKWIEELCQTGGYGYLIVDLGTICEASVSMMEYCDNIFMPESKGMIGISKEEAFHRMLHRDGREYLLEKIYHFHAPHPMDGYLETWKDGIDGFVKEAVGVLRDGKRDTGDSE